MTDAEAHGTASSGVPVTGPFEMRPAWRRMAWMVVLVVTDLRLVQDDASPHMPWRALQVVMGCLTAAALVQILLGAVRQRRLRWLVRLDDAGITVHGSRTVAWSEVAVVRWVAGGRCYVVEPVPGAAPLPMALNPRTFRPAGTPRRHARLMRRYGSPLILCVPAYDRSQAEIAAAVRRFSRGVPVLDA